MAGEVTTTVFRTPQATEVMELPARPHEMVITEHQVGGQVTGLTVADPLFEQSYSIGDGSVFERPVEAVLLAYWQHNFRQLSTRQLTNIAPFTTKRGTDSWSRLQHELSAAYITARYGGSNQQILEAGTHDASHRKSSHLVDDLLTVRGQEDAHEDVDRYLRRTGFVSSLQTRGLLDTDERFTQLDNMAFASMCGYANKEPSFANQSGKLGYMEAERLQYLGQEAAIWIYPLELVRDGVAEAMRRQHKTYGDHLVFADTDAGIDAARLFTKAQIRCHTEHWNDPINDVIDELVMTLDRRLLTNWHAMQDVNEAYVRYYPGDVLHVAEEDHHETYLKLAEKDPFTSALFKIVTKLAAHERAVHETYEQDDAYAGPRPPRWLSLQHAYNLGIETRLSQGLHKVRGTSQLVAEMLPGKYRYIDPFVVSSRGLWRRLSEVTPDIEEYRARQKSFIEQSAYDVIINYADPSLGLTDTEKRSLSKGFQEIASAWPRALQRKPMPDELLAKQVAAAGASTRKRAQTEQSFSGGVAA